MSVTAQIQRPHRLHLVQKYCPEFHLHPQEAYYPCDTEWFVDNCRLIDVADNNRVVLEQGKVTVASLADDYLPTMKLRLVVDESMYPGQLVPDATAVSNNAVPIYARCRAVEYAGKRGYDITYMTFYAYNGDYTVLGKKTGAHMGDWEHMTVRCDEAGELVKVYYGAHRYGDGTWVPASQVPIDADTKRIQAYVALHGHGLYPKPGTQWRLLGLANDRTSDKGFRWQPKRCVLVSMTADAGDEEPANGAALPVPDAVLQQTPAVQKETSGAAPERILVAAPAGQCAVSDSPMVQEVVSPAWISFKGTWGSSNSPGTQAWWSLEHLKGNSVLQRCLCPCVRP